MDEKMRFFLMLFPSRIFFISLIERGLWGALYTTSIIRLR